MNFQGFWKYCFVEDLKILASVIKFIDEIYKKNSQLFKTHANLRNYKLCEKYSKCEYIVKIIYVLNGLCATNTCLYSVIIYFVTADRVLTIPMSFPFLDINTTGGFIALLLLQALVLLYSYIVFSSFDSILIVIVLNMRMISAIITGHFDDFRQTIALNSKCTKLEIRRQLLNIIWMHRKYNE